MEGSTIVTYVVGFSAQLLFSARLLVQWIKSERAGRVLSPTLFWQLSLIASFLMMCYGILRNDPVILFGQVLSYFVYIRNLHYKNAWKFIPMHFKVMVIAFPLIAIAWLSSGLSHNIRDIIENNNVPMYMLIWGYMGTITSTSRFVYQWYFSEKQQKSVLPVGFWVIGLCGALMVIGYAVYREDLVLFLGNIFSIVIYSRNIILLIRQRRASLTTSQAKE